MATIRHQPLDPRALRAKAGLSAQQVATRMGVARYTIERWERRELTPRADQLIALAEVLDLGDDQVGALGRHWLAPT